MRYEIVRDGRVKASFPEDQKDKAYETFKMIRSDFPEENYKFLKVTEVTEEINM